MEQDSSKERILDALIAVLVGGGLENVSIRNVATEAGVSAGAVQHHFASKNALINAAMLAVNERFQTRLRASLEAEPSAQQRLRIFCQRIACVDDEDLDNAIVWTAFAAHATAHSDVQAIHSNDWARTEDFTHQLLASAFPEADVCANDAAIVLAITDGIAVARAAENGARMNSQRATALIEQTLTMFRARARATE
ncbi:TetR/AcrR family transcriptional regulator [Humidisolicoccus flavus]|uniref:TetR/AcrR family transcriptional regulator n=1 Tax=Humidisolicoccus flavus TaxID=3111414 RepID=UPI0032444FC6